MKFSVEWVPAAEQQLASIWLAATARKAIREAADRLIVPWQPLRKKSGNLVR